MKLPDAVEKVVDKVLAYHPKPKSKAAKKRRRKTKQIKVTGSHVYNSQK